MPTYDFACKHCHKRFSKNLPIGTGSTECECGKVAEKVLSMPAIRFSGSGFYATDSRSPAAQTEKPTETKAEVKPEAKPCCGGGCKQEGAKSE